MSGLKSSIFRETNNPHDIAPGFVRMSFSKNGVIKTKGHAGLKYIIIPTATMVNNSATNLNSSTSRNSQSIWDITSGYKSNKDLFTKQTDGITVNEDGIYEVSCSLYQESTVVRSNVGVLVHKSGSLPSNIISGASGYIRSNSGHNESSSNVTNILELSSGDQITVSFKRYSAAGTVSSPAGSSILIVKKIG